MKLEWREVTESKTWSAYLYYDKANDLMAPGFIEQLGPNEFNACDMSTAKWQWRRFDNIPEAKRWLEVCARMNHAS